jgi:replicative DNA helicase
MVQAAYRQDVAECQREMERMTADGYGHRKIVTLADAFEDYIREISEQRASGRKLIGLDTGFSHLNWMTGGFRKGEMIVLAARPSMGKSALALDIGRAAQKSLRAEGKTVVFFSLEMPAKSLGGRGYTAEYKKPNDAFSIGANDETWKETLREIERNAKHFTEGSGGMILNEEGSLTIDQLRAACHGYKAGGRQIGLIIVDYLQLISVKGENRVQEIGAVSRGLKLLAKDMDCPVLVLSQLSRKNEERADKKPMLSDLRDSGAIEQDADVVLFLHREEYYFPDTEKQNTAELMIAKQRNGPTGTIELVWIKDCTTFRTKEFFKKTDEEMPELFGEKE